MRPSARPPYYLSHPAFFLRVFAVWVTWWTSTAFAQHAGDAVVGRNQAGQLAVINLPVGTVRLPFVSSGSNVGWASSSLGFDRVISADPVADLYPMNASGEIVLEIVEIEPGLSFRSFTAFNSVIADAPGEILRLGLANSLHYHPIVLIDASVVGQEFQGVRKAILRLLDNSGGHTPSLNYTLTFAPPALPEATYVLRLLDVHEATHSMARAISDAGVICSDWHQGDPALSRGVITSAVELQHPATPTSPQVSLGMTGINRSGDTIGWMGSASFVRNGGILADITPPGFSVTRPRGINDAGKVVGTAATGAEEEAWTWDQAAGFSTLPGLPGYTGQGACGINNSGQIIGYSNRMVMGTLQSAAWFTRAGSVQPLTFAGTTEFTPIAINDAEDILVSYRRAETGNATRHAIRRATGWQELKWDPLAGMTDYRVHGMNNYAEIVGSCQDAEGKFHGFRGRPAWLTQVGSGPFQLSLGYAEPQLQFTVESQQEPVSYRPGEVTIHAGAASRQLVPSSAAFAFLGTPGTAVWIIPQQRMAALPQLGISNLTGENIFESNQIHLDLDNVQGPGSLIVYLNDDSGNPLVKIDSRDGITAADRITSPINAPTSYTWAFTAPGTWRAAFRLRGTLAESGVEVVSNPQTLTFFIEPGNLFPATIESVTDAMAEFRFIVGGEVGRECVIRSSTDLRTWQNERQFFTDSLFTTITTSKTGPSQFYQAIIR